MNGGQYGRAKSKCAWKISECLLFRFFLRSGGSFLLGRGFRSGFLFRRLHRSCFGSRRLGSFFPAECNVPTIGILVISANARDGHKQYLFHGENETAA
jgi:hypothetical protein